MTADECLRFLNELIDEVDLSLRMPGHHRHENARLMQRRANLVAVQEVVSAIKPWPELSYPGRPDRVVLHTENCAAHPRWSAGPCNCGHVDPEATITALREALKHSERALASLPVDALGMGHDDHCEWPLRDELLTQVRAALKLAGER